MYFITLVAWVLGIFCSLRSFVICINKYNYENNKLEKLLNEMKGIKRTYHYGYSPIIAVVSICWLINYYFG